MLFNIPKPWGYVIAGFVVLFLLLLALKARAASSIEFEAGYPMVVGLDTNWDGPIGTSFQCGLDLVASRGGATNNAGLQCLLIDGYKTFDLGLGAIVLHHADQYNGSAANFSLLAQWRMSSRWTFRYRHWSNAGMSDHNQGRDMLMLAYKF
jgi:hypothetical protein